MLGAHVPDALHHFLKRIVIEQIALFQGALDGVLEIFQGLFIQFAEGHVGVVEAAAQQEIGQRLEEIFGVDAEIFTGVSGVANSLHR